MIVIDTSNNILLTRGDTATINISIKDDTGAEYELQEGDQIIFSVKRLSSQASVLIEKVLTTKQLVLDTDDTDTLSFGKYKYDMVLISGSEVSTFICFKDFIIGEEVHNLES